MSIDLTGNVVLVTGATGDIGAEYVSALVAAGAEVVATDVVATAAPGEALAHRASEVGPGKAVFAAVDVTSDDDLQAAIALAVDRFGGLDALVNNAAIYRGLGPKRPLTELTNDD
jgi:NAD(P)-dependent dehydrogenase (short-subunit alcohol dehydrogenase family)